MRLNLRESALIVSTFRQTSSLDDLPPHALAALRAVGDAAERAGVEPYLVGGATRDLILGRGAASDLDISLVRADASTFDAIASLTGGKVTKRSQFNTARLDLDEMTIDLAMARVEEYPSPGSLPVVRQADSMRQDLARRDFSINAMAISLSAKSWGELLDPHEGMADLSAGLIRALHRVSFRDDPTRIFRAARYAARLEMRLEPDTLIWVSDSTGFIRRLSPARVRNELELIFDEPDSATRAMELLWDWGALSAIHRSLRYDARAWKRFALATSGLTWRERAGVGYAMLCDGVSDADASAVVAQLRPDAASRRAIQDTATVGRIVASQIRDRSNSELAALLDPLNESAILGGSLSATDAARRRFEEYLSRHRDLKPHLAGDDLIRMGIPRGPDVGRTLARLRAARIDGDATTAEDERALVRRPTAN